MTNLTAFNLHELLSRQDIPIWGVSYQPNGVHFKDEATEQHRIDGNGLAEAFNSLAINTAKTAIDANGIDETVITCPELGDNFDYTYWRDTILVDSGAIADGNLEFSTNTPGTYLFETREQGGYATGYIEIIAS